MTDCTNARILAIGPQTEKALNAHGITLIFDPQSATGEGIVATLEPMLNSNDHVLIPTSSEADDTLLELSQTGAKISKVAAYTNHAKRFARNAALD